MGSYVAASIRIGGRFQRSLIPQLLDALQEDGIYQPADEESPFTEEILETAIEDGELRFYSSQARSGMFETLEAFLRKAGVPYVRNGAACGGEFEADVSFWSPEDGDDTPATLVTNEEGVPVIPAKVAVDAWNALRVGNTHAALEVLSPYSDGYEVPTLPSFEFVDGEP